MSKDSFEAEPPGRDLGRNVADGTVVRKGVRTQQHERIVQGDSHLHRDSSGRLVDLDTEVRGRFELPGDGPGYRVGLPSDDRGGWQIGLRRARRRLDRH